MCRHLKTISIFLFLFLIFLPSFTLAQTSVGKFTFVQGRVDVLRQPAPRAVPVKMGDTVFVGDIIRAKSDSKAEITFKDGNIVRVAPNTRVEISEYMFDEAKGKGILKLSRGKVQTIIQEKIAKRIATFGEANRFEIHTPTAIAGARGCNFIVSFQRNSSSVLVLEGTVLTYNPKFPDMVVTVNAGYITTIPLNQPVQPARPATDAEKNMYKGDFAPGGSGEKSEAEDTVISEATTGSAEPGAPSGPESLTPMSTLTDIVQPPPINETQPLFIELPPDTLPIISINLSASPQIDPDATLDIDLSSNKPVTFSYKVDNNDWVQVTPPFSVDVSEGPHVLQFRATDTAGNTYTTPAFPFELSRYALEGFATGTGSILTGAVTEGKVVGILSQSWGGWNIKMEGSYQGTPSGTWKIYAGGKGYDSPNDIPDNPNGYWLDRESNTGDNTYTLTYLTTKTLGKGTGSVTFSYKDADTWEATHIGTEYTETPLAFGGGVGSELFEWDPGFYLVGNRTLIGLMGGTESLWTGTSSFLSLGTYDTESLYNGALWGVDIGAEPSGFTSDGGAFLGIMGGISLNDNLEGRALALYIKPNGEGYETGYIISDNISGSLYPGIGEYELGGDLISVSMGTTSISPDNLSWDGFYGDSPSLRLGKASGTIEGDIEGHVGGQTVSLVDQPWGILWGSGGGSYTDILSPNWIATAKGESYGLVYGEEGAYWDFVGIWGSQTIGSQWSDNKLLGTTTGYFADISSTPITGITVGETLGTFDPNLYTWQAIQMGVWLETNKFLQMAQSPEGIAKLQQLNIPCVEVGRTNLSGALLANDDYVSMVMDNVIFFAPNTGAKPSIWATNEVTGRYTFTVPGQLDGVHITDPVNQFNISNGNGISADFQFKQWDNGKWLGTIENGKAQPLSGGSYSGDVDFHGAGAGGYTGTTSGSISGTAAGVAK